MKKQALTDLRAVMAAACLPVPGRPHVLNWAAFDAALAAIAEREEAERIRLARQRTAWAAGEADRVRAMREDRAIRILRAIA